MRTIAVIVAIFALAACSQAPASRGMAGSGPVIVGDLTIKNAYARPTVGDLRLTAAYLTISNSGRSADKLVGAASSVAGTTELHTHVRSGGTMQMRAVESIAIPAGSDTSLEPGGDHIMLLDLKSSLEVGDVVDVTLTFEGAGKVTIDVPVLALGEAGGHGH